MPRKLTIAIASGKGGTGKTTLSTSLAAILVERGEDVVFLDCDVEEPDGHIFLKPQGIQSQPVNVMIPRIIPEKCNFCGACGDACQFNALAVLADRVMVFPSLCHSCGACYHICPEKAIEEIPREIGTINYGNGQGVKFFEGRLNIGEALSPPVIKVLRSVPNGSRITIIDAPPGTSCPVIEAVRNTDFVVLVTEPTPFGLHDLKLAVEMVRAMNLPFGVVINRADMGDDRVEKYCKSERVDILLKIPFDRRLAEEYSEGSMTLISNPEYAGGLVTLMNDIKKRIEKNGTGDSQR
nr:ATP-binding protein [candidate division Zixibacteria bacterium]